MTRRSRTARTAALAILAAAGGGLTAPPAAEAAPTRAPTLVQADVAEAGGWRVVSSPFADLWYHGLAVVGFHGFGPHPLYDVAYGRRAVRERPESPLAVEGPGILSALEQDPAFELLHFIPVYLVDAGPREALDGLRRVAGTRPGSDVEVTGPLGSRLQLVARALPQASQRAVLGRLVDALAQEWSQGMAGAVSAGADARAEQLTRLEERWRDTFEPALGEYLGSHGLKGGRIVATPALGLEGRFFQGDLRDPEDNVVVLGFSRDDANADAVLAPVVRELCFPAVRAAFEFVKDRYLDRVAASRASDAAATRCGELLLEALLPGSLPAYRNRFGLQGPTASAWSSLPDPAEGRAWDEALMRALNLHGGS